MSIATNLTVTKTDSVRYHLFWELDRQRPEKGDYVRLPLFEPSVGCNPCSIVKRIGCMSGDQLTREGMKFYCNGDYLGAVKKGKYATFDFNGKVPVGMIFLIGDRENSYDARYFGFKSQDDIEEILLPLL